MSCKVVSVSRLHHFQHVQFFTSRLVCRPTLLRLAGRPSSPTFKSEQQLPRGLRDNPRMIVTSTLFFVLLSTKRGSLQASTRKCRIRLFPMASERKYFYSLCSISNTRPSVRHGVRTYRPTDLFAAENVYCRLKQADHAFTPPTDITIRLATMVLLLSADRWCRYC